MLVKIDLESESDSLTMSAFHVLTSYCLYKKILIFNSIVEDSSSAVRYCLECEPTLTFWHRNLTFKF
jgi:hypothetical protein